MIKDIRFVAMDLDGTLTNSEKQITQRTRNAIDSLRERYVKIVLASGRPHIGIKTVSDALEMAMTLLRYSAGL